MGFMRWLFVVTLCVVFLLAVWGIVGAALGNQSPMTALVGLLVVLPILILGLYPKLIDAELKHKQLELAKLDAQLRKRQMDKADRRIVAVRSDIRLQQYGHEAKLLNPIRYVMDDQGGEPPRK